MADHCETHLNAAVRETSEGHANDNQSPTRTLGRLHALDGCQRLSGKARGGAAPNVSGGDWPPHPPLALFKMSLLQHCYGLSDPQCEELGKDRLSWRCFAGWVWPTPCLMKPRWCVSANGSSNTVSRKNCCRWSIGNSKSAD